LEKISTFDASAQFSTSQEGLVASGLEASIVRALAAATVPLTSEQVRAAVHGSNVSSISKVLRELVAAGLVERGQRRRSGGLAPLHVFRLRRAADLPGAPASASAV
jgi:predicted transcriptional regulator